MKLITNSSGSQGNSYILQGTKHSLLLDCGIRYKDIIKSLNYDISRVSGCCVGHHHTDHLNNQSVTKLQSMGIKMFSNEYVAQTHKGFIPLKHGEKVMLDDWRIMALKVPHGDCPNIALVIEHDEMGRLLYATDLSGFPYKIVGCNHLLIEANYSEREIVERMMDNEFTSSQYENHLSFEKCLEIIKRHKSINLQTIGLLHLSMTNSNEKRFKETTQKELGFGNVHILKTGTVLELSPTEF